MPKDFAVVGVARRPLEQSFAPDMKDGIISGGGGPAQVRGERVLAGNAAIGGRGGAGRWRGRHTGSLGPKAAVQMRLVRDAVRWPAGQLVVSTSVTVSSNSCRDNYLVE